MIKEIKIGSKNFSLGNHTYIVGILNITPDSFSDGGYYNNLDSALIRVEKMISSGADIIDIGGESTRPGYKIISEKEEIERVAPIIRQIKSRWDIPISIDTYKSNVAKTAIDAGADIINDIWGLKYDKDMVIVAKESKLPICIMHNRKQKDTGISENDFISKTQKELEESINIAKNNGIEDGKIIIDPGIGFGKTYEQNLYCIKNLDAWKKFDYPILLGASRKSVIGLALNLPLNEREEGTLAISSISTLKGCDFLRVHDVEKNRRAISMIETIFHI